MTEPTGYCAEHSCQRQTKFALIVILRAPRHKANDDSLASLPTCIDSAKGDVRVTKSADLVSRPKLQIERSRVGSDRNDARRLRGFVGIIASLGSSHKKEYQAPKKPSLLKRAC